MTPLMGSSKAPERRIQKMPAKKVSRVIYVQKNNQLRYNFTGVPETWNPAVPHRRISKSLDLLGSKSSDLEPSSKPATTGTGDIRSDTGRQLGQSTIEFEDLLGHHGDGLRRRDDSPVISNGGTNESRENSQCDNPGWNE